MTVERQKIYEFLAQQHLGVLATLHANGAPEAAVIQITATEDFRVIFDCLPDSRKAANLITDGRVALVVGWANNITVQIEGIARQLAGSEFTHFRGMHIKHNPPEKAFLEKGALLYLIEPIWIRYQNFNAEPPEILILSTI